jgi:hypothetical protein
MSKQPKILSALIGTAVLVGSALPLSASAAESGEVPYYLDFGRSAGQSAAPLPVSQQGRLDSGEIPYYYAFASGQAGTSSASIPAPSASAVVAANEPGEVPYYFQLSRPESTKPIAGSRGLGGNVM